MLWRRFLICFFFGFWGVHKFMEKKIGIGLLYLCTMGLFGFGWLYDCIRYLVIAIKGTQTYETHPDMTADHSGHGFLTKKALLWILTTFLALIAFAYLPHISGFLALAAAIIAAPIEKWQVMLSPWIKRKAKGFLVAGMAILALLFPPSTPKTPSANPTLATAESAPVVTVEVVTPAETLPPVEVTKISFDSTAETIGIGRTQDIPFALYPDNAATDTLEVSVDHPEIATVSLEAMDRHTLQLTGILPGEVTLTVKSGEVAVATKAVTIVEVMPEEIAILAEPQTPRIGSGGQFTAVFDPLDVTNQAVTWESDSQEVLLVKADGSYEALALGTATVTATHKNGVAGTIQMQVLPIEVEAIALSADWEEGKPFCKNTSMTLTAEISPENAADKSLTWDSSDEAVATVSPKGVVKAIAPGNAIVTATAANGITGTYAITVDVSPQKFRVSASISIKSNDHVGNKWTTGFTFNSETLRSGGTVSIMPGETFTAGGWAQDNDSRPDFGSYWERLTLTEEMCQSGFTVEGDADVYENSGRYSGNCAVWHVKLKFAPIH